MGQMETRSDQLPGRRILLLGLGNDILSDDAIGLIAVRRAQEHLPAHPQLKIVASSEMGLALLDEIVGFTHLVLVDAIQTGQHPPGTIYEISGDEITALPAVSPHFLGLGETLALGRELGLPMPGVIRVLVMEVEDAVTVATRLTESVAGALPDLVQKVVGAVSS